MLPDVAEHVRHVFSVVRARNPRAATRACIADSWVRCSNDYQLDPASAREPAIVKAEELQSRTDRLDDMIQIARAEMRNLHQQLAGSGYAILLTDRDGVLLDICGDPEFTSAAHRHGLICGAVWSERFQGTNGVGTCLVERTPIYVHHNEHFLARYSVLTCSAAPIFDPDGALIAVLVASGNSRLGQQHTLALVNMSAQTIENRSFIRTLRDRHLVRFHSRPEFIGTLNEGVIALDALGKVVALNRQASFQLGPARARELPGKTMGELFDTSLSDLCDISTRKSFHPTPIFDAGGGARFYAVGQRPQPPRRRSRPADDTRAAGEPALSALDRLHCGDAAMGRAIAAARRAAGRGMPILLCGETGVGKNRFAAALHLDLARNERPLIVLNCAGMGDERLERELIGDGQSPGLLAQARGGTLLLDEPASLSLQAQARLLRAMEAGDTMQAGDAMRAGDAEPPQPIQWLLATRFDLAHKVEQGLMRDDFYYGVSGVTIRLPALRQRSDLIALTEHLLKELLGVGETVEVDESLKQWIAQYPWPGNVRQLRHALGAMLALRESDRLTFADVPDHLRAGGALLGHAPGSAGTAAVAGIAGVAGNGGSAGVGGMAGNGGAPGAGNGGQWVAGREGTLPAPDPIVAGAGEPPALNSLAAAERAALLRELERHHWGISKAARALGISRNTLYRRMERLKLREPGKRH